MYSFKKTVAPFLAAGAILGLASAPAFAGAYGHITTMQSSPSTYGYSDEAPTNQRRCESVEQHYAHFPKAGSMAREGGTLVPGDGNLASEKAAQLDLAIASGPVCG
ncbi:hypothetical protein [Aurantimonas sp. VKM B-3413]|uniref:hypothetical protein n=1 Tax=Aurantimonas sp. VKM B-3413 TaxID=2779401 RepID=UPI001E50733C|nr:hypothetical protein [Aurantimonas sp. VKM B-3413]MCB8840532.1 hypothetical protein [Aurantimonas sp. VKM B-3413]